MIRLPPRSTPLYSSAASDVYKRQGVREFQPRLGIRLGIGGAQLIHHAPILQQDCRRDHDFDQPLPPRIQYFQRATAKEDAGHEDVRVDHYSHWRPRTAAMAFVMSERFIPAFRA